MANRFIPELALNASSVTLTLSSGAGQVPIPDVAQKIGVYTSASALRIGFEIIPSVTGSATGSAISTDFAKGIPVLNSASNINWYEVGSGFNRVLYLRGSTSDVIIVSFV